MMRGWKAAFILICVLFSGLALADIYYWVDDQGTQHYTTGPESIPDPYRSKARLLPLPVSPPAPPERERTPRDPERGHRSKGRRCGVGKLRGSGRSQGRAASYRRL